MATTIPPRWTAIGSRIRDARIRAGYSQEGFATAIGTSRRHVMRLERGQHRPSHRMLDRIASATSCTPVEIDPDAEEADMQLAATLLELLRAQIRQVVREEFAERR